MGHDFIENSGERAQAGSGRGRCCFRTRGAGATRGPSETSRPTGAATAERRTGSRRSECEIAKIRGSGSLVWAFESRGDRHPDLRASPWKCLPARPKARSLKRPEPRTSDRDRAAAPHGAAAVSRLVPRDLGISSVHHHELRRRRNGQLRPASDGNLQVRRRLRAEHRCRWLRMSPVPKRRRRHPKPSHHSRIAESEFQSLREDPLHGYIHGEGHQQGATVPQLPDLV